MQRSSSDQPTAHDVAQIPPFAPAPGSPFAWDEGVGRGPAGGPSPTADDEEAEGRETAALQDWYRYIDSLARPPRRLQEDLDLEDEAPEEFSRQGDTETGRATDARAPLASGAGQRGAGSREGDLEGRPDPSAPHGETALEEAGEDEAPRQPAYLSWGEPWTPPPAVPMDDAAAQAIVAELAPEVPEAPPVNWEPVRAEVPVPDLAAFIPALETVEPPPRTREELLASIPAPPSVEPLASDAPAPDAGFTAPSLEAGAAWQPPTRLREEPASSLSPAAHAPAPASVDAAPPVTTTALVRLPTPPEEDSSRLPAPGSRLGQGRAVVEAGSREPADPASLGAPGCERSELPSIATIRERLPHHMERLLQVPTSEVAQNSYKSPFRETREELIHRLLDPSLSLEDAARLLGVCPTTVRRYTNKGLLHHYRTQGNQRRFRLSDVLTFLDEHGSTWLLQEDDAETENEE